MKAVDLVKIEKIIPIYKNGEIANAIEVARVQDMEGNSCEFNIIVAKGIYKIGDEVIYIQPDYCVPDNDLFADYWRPMGDPKKSRLGKRGRIRAVKFNLNFAGDENPIYSNGIILPKANAEEFLNKGPELQEELSIVKYVSEEKVSQYSGLIKGDIPYFLYKTDEPRIELLRTHIDEIVFAEGLEISATIKRDGSSTTIYVKNDSESNELTKGICTRTQEKEPIQEIVDAYKNENGVILRKGFNKPILTKGWFDDENDIFYTLNEPEEKGFEKIMKQLSDAWVDTVNKHGYLDKLEEYCIKNDLQLALRGELIGVGASKGSGNKLNPDSNSDAKIIWFGIDDLSGGHAERIHYGQKHNLKEVCEALGFEYTEEVFSGVFNYDQMIKISTDFFRQIKQETGKVIEGLVFRTKYNNKLSTKYINPEYDANS
jgi:hypothetical protein